MLAPALQSKIKLEYSLLLEVQFGAFYHTFAEVALSVAQNQQTKQQAGISPVMHKKQTVKTKKPTVKEVQRALKMGQQHARRGEWADAVKHLLIAWDVMPDDMPLLTVLAHCLVQLGVREQALAVLQRALNTNEPTVELIGVIQRLALQMDFFDIAVKLCAQLIAMDPKDPAHYVHMATAYSGLGKYDESIDMLQAAIPFFPENSDLWNVLATQVRERDGCDAADVFFEEALRLNPNDHKIISNYSISFTRRNQYDRALELALRAIDVNPDVPDPHIGAGQLLFMKGEMKDAWGHYAHRLSTRRKANQTQIYTHNLPLWQGQDLSGKTLMVTAEQGIGDEVMWGSYLPFLYEQAEKLVIGCDYRLVSIFKRRFPNAFVAHYADRIESGYRYRSFPNAEFPMRAGELSVDYYIPIGSSPSFAWQKPSDVKPHTDGYLKPCPEIYANFKERFDKLGKKPKVGLAWRSGLMSSTRSYLYASVERLAPLMELAGKVEFINLQYGNVAEEIKSLKEAYGVDVHTFDDVDLKLDIEANLAIASLCDVVVSSHSAPGMFSLASGTPTIFMSSAVPWWSFGSERKVLFAQDVEYIANEGEADWDYIMPVVTERVAHRLNI